jgi:hypothetical protein
MAEMCHCGREWKLTNKGCCSLCLMEAWAEKETIVPSQSSGNREPIRPPRHIWKPAEVDNGTR